MTSASRLQQNSWYSFAIFPLPSTLWCNWKETPSFRLSLRRKSKDWTLCTMIWCFRGLTEGGLLSCLNSNVDKKAFQVGDYWDQRWIFWIAYSCLPKLLYSAQNKWEKPPKFHLLPGYEKRLSMHSCSSFSCVCPGDWFLSLLTCSAKSTQCNLEASNPQRTKQSWTAYRSSTEPTVLQTAEETRDYQLQERKNLTSLLNYEFTGASPEKA